MIQRNIWMKLLLIGLISLLSYTSCKNEEVDNAIIADYIYINPTLNSISIQSFKLGNDTIYEIKPGETFKITEDLFAGNNNAKIVDADSVFIETSSNKSTSYYPEINSPRNIIKLENYVYLLITKNHHEYKFTFIESDFN